MPSSATPTPDIYTLSLHDALPISRPERPSARTRNCRTPAPPGNPAAPPAPAARSEEHTSALQSRRDLVCRLLLRLPPTSTLFPYTTLFRSRGRNAHPLELVTVERLHHQEIQRHRPLPPRDRKSTRLHSSHVEISYAVFCYAYPRHLHSFPTRRSSDLAAGTPIRSNS